VETIRTVETAETAGTVKTTGTAETVETAETAGTVTAIRAIDHSFRQFYCLCFREFITVPFIIIFISPIPINFFHLFSPLAGLVIGAVV